MKKICSLFLLLSIISTNAYASPVKLVENKANIFKPFSWLFSVQKENPGYEEYAKDFEHSYEIYSASGEVVEEKSKTKPIYEDMNNHWAEYSANQLAEHELLRGFKIGNKYYFYPDETISRGDFIMYVVTLLEIDADMYSGEKTIFKDDSDIPLWQKKYAVAAYKNGIIKGVRNKDGLYFSSQDTLTRIETAQILNNIIKPKTKSVLKENYADFYLIPDWAENAVNNMTAYGILNGYEDKTIRPYVKMTRAMSAQMLWQLYKYNEKHHKSDNSKIK